MKTKTIESTILEILASLILIVAIAVLIYAVDLYHSKRYKPDNDFVEMLEYHSGRGYTAFESNGYINLTK